MTKADLLALVASLGVIGMGWIAYSLFRGGDDDRKKIRSRMEDLGSLNPMTSANEMDELFRGRVGRQKWTLTGTISDLLGPIGGGEALRTLVLMGALAGGVGFVIAHNALALTGVMLYLIPLGLGVSVPYLYIGRLKEQRIQRFLDAFPDAIDMIVRAVRAGIPASEAMSMAGRELPGPVATEMGRIAEEISIGINPESAISEAAIRIGLPDFSFFAVTLILQRETGGNLAETLENLSNILRQRKEMRLKIRALTAEGRFTSKVISLLPVIVVIGLYFLNREYVLILFNDPVGQTFLGAATGLILLGSFILGRMIKLEV